MGEARREQWEVSESSEKYGGQQEDQLTGHPQGEEQGEQERPHPPPPGHHWEVRHWDWVWAGTATILLLLSLNFSFRLAVSSEQMFIFVILDCSVHLLSLQCWNFVFWRSNFNEIHNHKCSQLMKTIYGTKTNLKDLMWRNQIPLRTNLWKSNQIQPRLGCLVNCVKYISDHSRI